VDTTDAISALQSYVDVDLLGNAGELTQLLGSWWTATVTVPLPPKML